MINNQEQEVNLMSATGERPEATLGARCATQEESELSNDIVTDGDHPPVSTVTTSVPQNAPRSRGLELKARELAAPIMAETRYSFAELVGHRRWKMLTEARRQLYVACWRSGMSLVEIGIAVGGRDHSTIMAGLRKTLGNEVYDREMTERYPGYGFVRSRRPALAKTGVRDVRNAEEKTEKIRKVTSR